MSRPAFDFATVVFLAIALACFGCGKNEDHADGTTGGTPTGSKILQVRGATSVDRGNQTPVVVAPVVSVVSVPTLKEWGVRETAADALGRIGVDAVPALVATLTDPEAEVRLQACSALARI